MKRISSYLFAIIVILATSFPVFAISPEQMPNVQLSDRREFISDPDGLLSSSVKAQVNEELYALRKQTSVEMVVAIPPDIDDMEIQQWSEKLFTSWGIGKSDKDNGVLLVISPEARQTFIMTGYGVEGVLPDIACKKIINRAIIPAMKEGDLDEAVENSVSIIVSALEDPAVAEELKSSESDNYSGDFPSLSPEVFIRFIKIIATILFLVAASIFIVTAFNARKKGDNYQKAQCWRGSLTWLFWIGLVACGAGLLFWALAFLIYRTYRTRKIRCPRCSAKMRRLGEEEDNELLNDSQDFEEQIKTVDYDVWECPHCGTVERFPYKAEQKKYTECPKCHTIAMCLVSDYVTQKPTSRREGMGVKTYECQYCHHREQKPYKIPKEDDGSALAAAAILGAAASRSGRGGGGFGGGSFGGGFGGGATGGGGAGGSW